MSGGGGSSSDGGNEQAAAKAAMTTQAAYSTGSYNKSYNPGAGGVVTHSNKDESDQQAALQTYHQNLEDYDKPDKAHWKDTQKQIKQHTKGDHYDIKMSPKEYDKFNEDMNKYYGTKDVKYEPYGRAGQGTVNLTFKEHWDNIGHQSPALKFSPTLRFLAAAGRNVGEYLTSDYGTYKYGGPGTDSGGLLGGFGSGGSGQVSSQDREIMKNIAPEAPYIVSGIAKPTNSPAANWYNGLGNTSTNPGGFDLATEYANAKSAVAKTLNNKGPMAMLAVNDSPYNDWLKTKGLDRGIL